MKVRYLNYQTKSDPMNGVEITEPAKLAELLDGRRNEPPFLAELSGDNGYHIEFGIGGNFSCVQFSRSDREPPYLMAVSPHPSMKSGYLEFLTANTPTPVPARNILSFDELKEIAIHFLQTGEQSDIVSWRDLKRDAKRPSSR
jgi:immunity protein Imm1 of predicted polymorphic toxin system